MATLGRYLVLALGGCSLAFLMWSIALYTNRVNWFTDKAGNKENVGIVDKLDEQFKARNKAFKAAADRWERNAFAALGSLAQVEKERVDRREFYRDSLARVTEGKDRTGKVIAGPQLVRVLKRDNGNIKLDIGPNQAYYSFGQEGLKSMNSYTKEIADSRDQLKLKQGEADQLVKLYQGLTQEIFGSSNPRVLGIRDLIKEQEAVNVSAKTGEEYLVPIITERNAQTEIFTERNNVLQDRLTVLEEYLKKRKTNVNRE